MASRIALLFTLLAALFGQTACAARSGEETGEVTMRLPHKLREGEQAWLEVRLGVIERSDTVVFTTPDGKPIGALSPFGVRSGEAAGTYTIPVPAAAISEDRVELRVWIRHPGKEQRTPTASEVKSIEVKVSKASQ